MILIDLTMPVMDGQATAYALRKINPRPKFIAMSGMDESESLLASTSLGISHFIAKPYTAATLLKTIKAILTGL